MCFANTGQEDDKTLNFIYTCQNVFNLPIKWIESRVFHDQRRSSGYWITDYLNATRSNDFRTTEDTPFENVIKKYGIPNHSRLHCTRELKLGPIQNFAKHYFKGEKYKLALGIRMDEFDRINPKHKEEGIIYPLIDKEMFPATKKHVNFWWSQQKFRLELKGYQGNCITCYKKSDNKLMQIAKENPSAFDFFDSMEQKYGNPKGKVPKKGEKNKWNYKNVIFRRFRTAKDIVAESKFFNGEIIDDHIETESCEIFSNCGD